MSDAIFIHGKRGSGKTLAAMFVIQKYLREGRVVATNIDIYLERLLHASSKTFAYRLPDHPLASDLAEALPLGNPSLSWKDGQIVSDGNFSEEKNGLLVLDEVATFLNSRNWQGQGRADLISWLVQSRKYGWDLLLLAQHPRLIDAQVRDSLIEVQGAARRLDKIKVPILGSVWKWLTGEPLRFPKIHVVGLFYGFTPGAPLWDRWIFRGTDYYGAYNTRQIIGGASGNQAIFTYLSPWHVKGRYMGMFEMYKVAIAASCVLGLLVGSMSGYFLGRIGMQPVSVAADVEVDQLVDGVAVTGVMGQQGIYQVILSDGRRAMASSKRVDASGERYLVDGLWYRVAK